MQRGTTFAQEVDSRVLIANARHAAVAIEHGCEWIASSHLAKLPDLRWRHPLD